MTDNKEFWIAGGQTGARDQQFHERSQEEYPDVRIRLLEGIAEGEEVTEEVVEEEFDIEEISFEDHHVMKIEDVSDDEN